jgi:hypothetical protein
VSEIRGILYSGVSTRESEAPIICEVLMVGCVAMLGTANVALVFDQVVTVIFEISCI